MTLADFRQTLGNEAPPPVSGPLRALWWARKGDWEQAHGIVMQDEGSAAAWVHAYLHRVEGDIGNARYWYRRAGRAESALALDAEWDGIVAALLAE